MKRRAFTLIEILIAVFLLGLITASVYPLFFSEVKKLNTTFKFTEAGYEAQTQIEAEIKTLVDIQYDKDAPESTLEERQDKENRLLALNSWSDDSAVLGINLFDSTERVKVLSKTMQTTARDLGTGSDYQRNILVMLPRSKGYKELSPEVIVKLTKGTNKHKGEVEYKLNTFTKKSWEEDTDFCVYRWYIGDFNPAYKLSDLTVIREYNIAKNGGAPRAFDKPLQLIPITKDVDTGQELNYDSKTFHVIAEGPFFFIDGTTPLILAPKANKKTGDVFDPEDINMKGVANDKFNNDELVGLYGGKGLVFSAMPVTKGGEVGREVFSKMIDLGIPRVSHQLGFYSITTPEPRMPNQHRFTFLIKQASKPDSSRKYYFTIMDVEANTTLYPIYRNPLNAYVVNNNASNPKPRLSTDASGYVQFTVIMLPDRHYRISIMEDVNITGTSGLVAKEIMRGEINEPATP